MKYIYFLLLATMALVQAGLASAQTVPTSSARFKSYRNKVKQYTAEGRFRYKYCVGEYDTRAAAQKRLAEVRKVFPDAFVVSCRGTQIVK